MPPAWLGRIVAAAHGLAKQRRIRFTTKALAEMADLGCDRNDVRDVLLSLDPGDFDHRLRSRLTQEWLYVFKPALCGTAVYLKIALRDECVLISFHEDSDEEDQD